MKHLCFGPGRERLPGFHMLHANANAAIPPNGSFVQLLGLHWLAYRCPQS